MTMRRLFHFLLCTVFRLPSQGGECRERLPVVNRQAGRGAAARLSPTRVRLLILALTAPAAIQVSAELPAAPTVENIGPPSRFMEDVSRYELPPAAQSLAKQVPVTRQSYLDFIGTNSTYGIEAIVRKPDRGHYGVRHAFPALAQYDAHPNPRHAEALKRCLRCFESALRDEVRQHQWHEAYMYDPTLLCLYRHVFTAHGDWSADDERWFREFFLFLNRTVHVWGTPESFWRGPMHRATGEGIMKQLAVHLYPDAPEAAEWKRYADLQWNDWWSFRDNPINDINYFHGQIFPMILGAHLLGRDEVFTDPQMRVFWDRLIETTTPDGAVVPCGPAWGWNSHAGERMMALEFVAAHTGDGRYRFVAHRLFNQLLQQRDVLATQHILDHFSQLGCALAYFAANDAITPVPPASHSVVLYHKETLRVRNKAGAQGFLTDLDPEPAKAHIDCGLLCTTNTLPFKLCLRSGWQPGDMFMLVDLFPRHEPMNPTGVLGLTRYGAMMACAFDSKGVTDWLNMLRVEDLSGHAPRVKNTNPALADAYYMSVSVPEFQDDPAATYAKVVVDDYNGFPMSVQREFFFIKNRFVLIRDTAIAHQAFAARLGPGWATQNVGPHIGASWANTYFGAPMALGRKLHNPPMDLLIYHAPQPGRRLQIVDETADVRRLTMPFTLRYVWEGTLEPGVKHCFSQLLFPSPPQRAAVRSNQPGAATRDTIIGTGATAGVTVLLDTPGQTIWRIRSETGREEWLVLNDAHAPLDVAGLQTDARRAYLDLRANQPVCVLSQEASYLRLAGAALWPGSK